MRVSSPRVHCKFYHSSADGLQQEIRAGWMLAKNILSAGPTGELSDRKAVAFALPMNANGAQTGIFAWVLAFPSRCAIPD